jgi:Cof subfamily protein (haloacid dehalogenase superfamily)
MVVTDMDGTLLNSNGAVSERNATALRRAADAGAVVVVATGRPVWWLGPVTDAGFDGIAVCMNGGVIFDVAAKEVLSASPLQPAVMQEFVDAFAELIPGFTLAVERLGTSEVDSWAEYDYDHPWAEGEFRSIDRTELLSVPAVKMLIRHGADSSVLAAAAQATGVSGVSVSYSTNAGLIEIAAGGVNKGVAVAELAEQHGIDAADVMAFGDMPNDLEMLRWAGRSFAMQNADPIASAAATDTAPDNDSDGVAQVLERWF